MKQRLLIADDQADTQSQLKEMFEGHFELIFVQDRKGFYEKLNEQPDLIILSMHLPDLPGIEACKHIYQSKIEDKPFIIVVSEDAPDAVLREAYQYGVCDFVIKPFKFVAFFERVIRCAKDREDIQALKQKDSETISVAQTAMKQSASYGRALELVARLNECNSVQEIMEAVAKNQLNQDLRIAIQLRSDKDVYNYDVDTFECSDVELQIFDLLKDHGRIYHFGRRSIFNDRYVSILYKNMPAEGTLSFDAVLDVAAKLILAVNSRFISLLQHQALVQTRGKLNSAMEMLVESIKSLDAERKELIEQIVLKIGLSFHELDMSEDQEQFFVDLIEKEIRNRKSKVDLGELQSIISDCVESMVLSDENSRLDAHNHVEMSESDIELF